MLGVSLCTMAEHYCTRWHQRPNSIFRALHVHLVRLNACCSRAEYMVHEWRTARRTPKHRALLQLSQPCIGYRSSSAQRMIGTQRIARPRIRLLWLQSRAYRCLEGGNSECCHVTRKEATPTHQPSGPRQPRHNVNQAEKTGHSRCPASSYLKRSAASAAIRNNRNTRSLSSHV